MVKHRFKPSSQFGLVFEGDVQHVSVEFAALTLGSVDDCLPTIAIFSIVKSGFGSALLIRF